MAGSSLIGSLAVSLGLETAAFKRGAREATTEMTGLQQRLQNIGQRMGRIGIAMSASITAPFTALVTMAVPAAREAREALGQVEAANRSMGQAAGFSTEQLQDQAGALMALSTFDDDEILRKVTANLLTFGNVSGDVFERTQLAIVNVSARMGTDLQQATMQLGRALNDPLKGMNALARAGIQFTDQQKAMIRTMVAAGDTAGAQRVMLGELERQFGGAAQAMRDATPGADVKNQWDNLLETIGELALNVLPPLTNALAGVLGAFNQLSPETQTFIIGAVAIAAALGPVLIALSAVVTLISSAIPVIASIGAGFAAFKVTMAAAAVAAGGLLPALTALVAPVLIPLAAAIAAVYIAWQNWETIGPFVEEMARAVGQALGGILDILKAVAAVLRGDFTAAWQHVKNAVTNIVGGIGRVVMAVLNEVRAALVNFLSWAFSQLDSVDARLRRAQQQREQTRTLSGDSVGTSTLDERAAAMRANRPLPVGSWGGRNKLAEDAAKVGQAMTKMAQDTQRETGNVINLIDVMAEQTGETTHQMMQHISARFESLGVAMTEPVREATGTVAERMEEMAERSAQAVRDMAREVHSLLARLFPEMERAANMQRDLALISGGMAGLSASQQTEARRRLYLQNGALDNVTPLAELPETLGPLLDDAPGLVDRLDDAFGRLGGTINDSVVRGLQGMMRGFGSLKDIALNALYAIGDAIIENLFKNLNGGGGQGGIGGAIASAIGGLFGGKRAMGGPVVPGKYYMVGERGPELAAFGAAGRIIPNSALGGASGPITVYQTYRFEGVAITQDQFMTGLSIAKQDTIAAVREATRRRA